MIFFVIGMLLGGFLGAGAMILMQLSSKADCSKNRKPVTPVKSAEFCGKCKYGLGNGICKADHYNCDECPMQKEHPVIPNFLACKCLRLKTGEPCPWFEKK